MNDIKQHYGKIALCLSIVVAIIDAYIILHYLAYPEIARNLAGGFTVAFPLYLKHEVLVWSIVAIVVAAVAYFIEDYLIEPDKENTLSKASAFLTKYAGGLAIIFFVVGLLANTIVRFLN
jgi:hypothetical protein